jgi:vesicle-fusing ATPase
MQQLDLHACFDRELAVPNVQDHKQLAKICREVNAFESEGDLTQALNLLRDYTGTDSEVGVGIKRVLLGIETARQGGKDRAGRFAEGIAGMMAASRA